MQKVMICDRDDTERAQLTAHIRACYAARGEGVQVEGCADWPALAAMVRRTDPDIVVVAQDGVEGLDTITSARLLTGKIIWFSDLDFGVQAYWLCVAYFSRKPVTYQKVARALGSFWEGK
ncbi:hypothetical protein LI291_07235 [Intestinibacillus massiliensis]|nr:hypothetical protein [Intestinibacillus massiliensis]